MTREINGFVVEPSTSYRRLFRRVTEPRHEYIFYITPPAVSPICRASWRAVSGTRSAHVPYISHSHGQ